MFIVAAYHVFFYLHFNFPRLYSLYRTKILFNLIFTSLTILLRGVIKAVESFGLVNSLTMVIILDYIKLILGEVLPLFLSMVLLVLKI